MTQFQPPTIPPAIPTYQPHQPSVPQDRPWSVAAISGFVLSWLGCIGIPAILGLILGVVGIAKTRGGVRRGRGLAIAALPISCVSFVFGIIGAFMAFASITALNMAMVQIPEALMSMDTDVDAAVVALREISSEHFKQSIDEETLKAWMIKVSTDHGKITGIDDSVLPTLVEDDDFLVIELLGKFINGPANLKITIFVNGIDFQLDDIAIDGLSPKDMR